MVILSVLNNPFEKLPQFPIMHYIKLSSFQFSNPFFSLGVKRAKSMSSLDSY